MNNPSPQTLIERHPTWLKVFASPHPFINVLYALPLLSWFAQLARPSWSEFSVTLTVGFFLGVLYWSFIEYGIHRWIYHGRYQNKTVREVIESFHIYHHRNLEDHGVITAGPLMIYPLSAILLTPVWYLVGDFKGMFGAVGLGVMLYYLFYEWVHYSIHRRETKSKYHKWITDYHMEHHKQWNIKFGNTVSLWDHLFGTISTKAAKK